METHPQAVQNVEFHQKRFGEISHCITCTPVDPLQWMGAVRMRDLTAGKNITSNPHDSSPLINVLWSEKLHVCKKQIYLEDILI